MKIRLKVGDHALTARLLNNQAAQDFASMLPLTLTMNDLFRREKFGHLPRALSIDGKRTHSYEIGQLIYWSPGPDLAIFYRLDGEAIPDPENKVLRCHGQSRYPFWSGPVDLQPSAVVGSRTGAILRRFGLSVSLRFL
jgi:hypothetical protein